MHLTCPECGTQIQADNINIHEKIAVCHHCDAVFQFTLPNTSDDKPKRRKVHQPSQLTIHDSDHLHMSFRTNWRLGQNEGFLTSLVFGLLFSFVTLIMLMERDPGFIQLAFGLVALAGFYSTAVIAYNQTHIEVGDHKISVSRRPLPGVSIDNTEVNLSNVESITTEESKESEREAYDLPRYHVYANRFDGKQQIIVKDVTEEYGLYIAQIINAELALDDTDLDTSRLSDDNFIGDQLDDEHLSQTYSDNQNHRYET